MVSLTSRWRAAVLLACLLAAQMHFFVESGTLLKASHECQVCKTGACAIPALAPSLAVVLDSTPLDAKQTPSFAGTQMTDASAPRAPPQS